MVLCFNPNVTYVTNFIQMLLKEGVLLQLIWNTSFLLMNGDIIDYIIVSGKPKVIRIVRNPDTLYDLGDLFLPISLFDVNYNTDQLLWCF